MTLAWKRFGLALVVLGIVGDAGVALSLAMTILFLALCLAAIWWTFKTGYRLKK